MKSLLATMVTGLLLASALGTIAFGFYALVHFVIKYW